MRYVLSIFLLLFTLLSGPALAAPCLPANSPNAQTVTAIKVDGQPVKEAKGIMLIIPKSTKPETATVAVGCAFPIGAVIELPQRTVIQLTSPNGNRITLNPGSRLRIHNVSPKGEAYGLERGKAFFSVKKALDFFNVDYQSFMALVRGTSFSVRVDPGKEIIFSVEEGKLRVKREVKVRIAEGDKAGTILLGNTLEAGKKAEVTYQLATEEYLATFKSYKDAEEYFRQKLNEDKRSGDSNRLMNGLNNMGMILCTLSKYEDAIPFFNKGLELARGKRDLMWEAWFLNNLGIAYWGLGGMGNLQRAIDHHEKSLAIRLQLFRSGVHMDIASSYNNLGNVYSDFGGIDNLQRAIKYHEKALKIRLELFPSGVHQDIAQSYNNLGNVYGGLGGTDNLQREIKYHENALKILLKLFPSGVHRDIAQIYNNIGSAFWGLGGTDNHQRAINYLEKALYMLLELFPSGVHQDIAKCYNNLGFAYFDLGGTDNLKQSLKCHEKALKIRLELFPSGVHQDIATSYNNLGNVYRDLGGTDNLKRSIDNYQRALKIQLQLFPSGMHLSIANSYNNLGNAYYELEGGKDNLQRVIQYHEKALKIRLELGVHQDIADGYNNLGTAYRGLGGTDNLRQAIDCYNKALKLLLQLFPSGVHRDIAQIYNNLRIAYEKLGDLKRAAEAQQKGIVVKEKLIQRGYISMSKELPGMYGNLAWYELFNKRYDTALRAAERGLELDPEKIWIRINEAHALLYLGREEEAQEIYLGNRNVKVNGKQTFAQVVLDDFRQLREKGLGIPAMDRIEEELKRGN